MVEPINIDGTLLGDARSVIKLSSTIQDVCKNHSGETIEFILLSTDPDTIENIPYWCNLVECITYEGYETTTMGAYLAANGDEWIDTNQRTKLRGKAKEKPWVMDAVPLYVHRVIVDCGCEIPGE